MSDKPCVLAFKRESWRDVVSTLRLIADEIERGDVPLPEVCAIVSMDGLGEMQVFGLGEKADDLKLIGLLRLGEQRIVDNLMSE